MTSLEAYYKFLIKINRNYTQGNITCDKATFVLIYNESQRKWLNRAIPEKTSDDIAEVQSIITYKLLSPIEKKQEYTSFELPSDWFFSADSFATCSKEKCKNQKVNLRQVKSITVRNLLADDSNRPSLEYEWSFYTIEGNKIKVYKHNFNVDELFFNYYKEPVNIDIEGYEKFDGSFSINVDPELADIFVDQIISEAATDYMRNYQNLEGLKIAQNRQQSES